MLTKSLRSSKRVKFVTSLRQLSHLSLGSNSASTFARFCLMSVKFLIHSVIRLEVELVELDQLNLPLIQEAFQFLLSLI